MLTTTEVIEKIAYSQLRKRVRTSVQSGTINNIVAQEISCIISDALNSQLAAERDSAIGRQPYERVEGSVKRNGYKRFTLPGLWGRLVLRRPAVRKGTLNLPLAAALKAAGSGIRDILAMRF